MILMKIGFMAKYLDGRLNVQRALMSLAPYIVKHVRPNLFFLFASSLFYFSFCLLILHYSFLVVSLFTYSFVLNFFFENPLCKGGKLFAKQSVFDSHLKGKKHLKALQELKSSSLMNGESKTASENINYRSKPKDIALIEYIIKGYVALLKSQRIDTQANVEHKQALTDKERVRSEIPT